MSNNLLTDETWDSRNVTLCRVSSKGSVKIKIIVWTRDMMNVYYFWILDILKTLGKVYQTGSIFKMK